MSKRVIAICVFIFLGSFVAGWAVSDSKSGFTYNGKSWKDATPRERIVYVRGYGSGYQNAAITKLALSAKTMNDADQKFVQRLDNYLSGEGKAKPTIGDIVNAINTFYADYRNVSVCWAAATSFGVMAVYGDPAPEERVAVAQKDSASGGCE